MPDFINDTLSELKAKRQAEKEQIAGMKPLEQLRKHDRDRAAQASPTPFKSRSADMSRASFGSGEDADIAATTTRRVEEDYSYMEPHIGETTGIQDAQGNNQNLPSTLAESFLSTAKTSVKRGTGELITSYGNLTNMLLSGLGSGFNQLGDFDQMALDGSMVSKFLQDAGTEMSSENQQFIPDNVANPEFKISTFLNPEFWAVHGGAFLPQLAEIALTAEVGKGAKFLVEKGMAKGFQGAIREGVERGSMEIAAEMAEESAKKGLTRKAIFGEVRNVTNEAFERGAARAGAQNTVNKGSGILGMTLTDKGTLTKGFGELVQTVSAGAFTNLSVGLKNAGEVYQTYGSAVKVDEEGNPVLGEDGKPVPLFTKEELGDMAAGVFQTNLQYMTADMLSWGLTYGKGLDMVKGLPGKVAGAAVTDASKVASGLFSRNVSPFLKKLAKVGSKMAFEGAEESVQESFEEWTKMKSYADIHGSLKGYQGKVSQDYDTKSGWGIFSGGFWDYYNSKDSEATRTIAAALGAAAGGAFNIGEVFNNQAETAYKFQDRFETINKMHNTPEGKANQETGIYRQMAELVMENKGGLFAEFARNLHDDGKITDSEFKRYGETYDQIAANYDKVKDLKMKGKKAFMVSVANEVHFNDKVQEATDLYVKDRDTMNLISETYINEEPDPKKKKQLEDDLVKKQQKLEKEFNQKIIPLSNLIAQTKEQQKNLILDKDAKPVEYKVSFTVDPRTGKNTQAVYTPVEKEFGMTEDEKVQAQAKIVDEFDNMEEKWNSAKEKGKQIISKGKQKFDEIWQNITGKNEKDSQPAPEPKTDQEQTGTEQTATTEGTDTTTGPTATTSEPVTTETAVPSSEEPTVGTNPLNESVRVVNKAPGFSDSDYQQFEKDGSVNNNVLVHIATKNLSGGKLNKKEQDIYNSFKSETDREGDLIEENLSKMMKDENFSDEDKQMVREMFLGKKKGTKSINDETAPAAADEKVSAPDIEDDIFGEARLKRDNEPDVNPDKPAGVIRKVLDIVSNLTSRGKKIKATAKNVIDSDFGTADFKMLAESIAVTNSLQKIYPDQNINVYAVQNIERTLGQRALGYTLASQIYIQENSWNQGSTLMHEASHIYFALNKDAATTRAFLNFLKKDTKLVNRVLADYDDLIQYRNVKTGDLVFKSQLVGKNYDRVEQGTRDAVIENLLSEKKIATVPIEEQEVIADELFVAGLEGPMSEKYNMFFQSKETGDEIQRQFFAKKWWNKVKETGENFGEKGDRQAFFNTLSDEDKVAVQDNLNSILNAFQGEIAGKDVSAAGRASRILSENDRISSRIDQIEKEIAIETGKMKDGELLTQRMKKGALEVMDDVDFDTIFDGDDRLAYSNKLMDVVKDFASKYNKGISAINRYNGKRTNWKNSPYLDVDKLRYQLSYIAQNSWTGSDFIRRLQDSEFSEIQDFMQFLNNSNRDDTNLMLQTLHWHEQNTSNINAVKVYVNENNVSSMETTLNNREKTILENAINNVTRPFTKKEREGNSIYMDRYNSLMVSARNIKKGDYTKADIYNVVEYLTGGQVNTTAIMEANRINFEGKVQNLDAVVVKFVNSESGLTGNSYSEAGQRVWKTATNGLPVFGLYGKDGRFKSGVRTMVMNLINENRKYTSNFTTIHADGTQHQSRIIDNYLSRGFKNMKRDARNLPKAEFFNKYGTLNKDKKGSHSNKMLEFLYNKIQTVGDIDLVEFGGIQNDYNDGKTSMLKSSDSVTERIGQFMIFANTQSRGSYLMDLGRFSDSSRAYYVEAPRTDTSEVFTVENGKVKFSNKAVLDNIFNTHKSMGYDGTIGDMKNDIEESIKGQIQFINDNINAFSQDPKFAQVIEKGKLNAKGQMLAANFEVNQIINGTNFTEIFFPSFKMQDAKGENQLIKRAKSASSPMFSFTNAHVEPIYLQDVTIEDMGDFDVTDAGFYILQEDAEKFQSAGGTLMPLGNAFKLLHTGVEQYNENTKGQNIYNKGYATVINEEVVLKNPELRGAYELLKSRKAQYAEKNGTSSDNLLDGQTHHIPFIVPMSATKSAAAVPAFYDTNVMSFEGLNAMADRGDFSQADALLDKFHYDKEGDFVGVSAENFGIQQVMDIDKNFTNTSVQLVKSLTSGMAINENQDEVLSLLNDIRNLSEEQIESTYDMLMNGDAYDIREFFKENVDKTKMDQVQRALIFDDNVSLTTPAVREIVKNTFANVIKQGGLKLKTPGNVLREKPSLYKNPYRTSSDLNAASGSNDLKFYQANSDGTFSKGEVVLPESMLQEGKKYHKITAREYLADNGKTVEENLSEAKRRASTRKVGYGKVFDEQNNHIGYYVEGDTIMATRIPSHGQQSTGVFEVVDFTGEEGNNIQLPNQFKQIIGSDNDGDQIFVQHKGRGTDGWNNILNKIEKLYLNPNVQEELRQGIEVKADVENALAQLAEVYGENKGKFTLPFSSAGRQLAFKDTMIAKANVGLAANLHTTLRMFGNYNVGIATPISIDGVFADQFMDVPGESVTIKSAKLFNIILDNAKNGNAEKLGINTNTVAMAMILSNLNFNLDKVALVLNHPIVKRYSELKDNNTSVFNKDEKYNAMAVLREEFKVPSVKEVAIDTTAPAGSNAGIFNLLNVISQIESETADVGAVLSIHNNMTVNAFEMETILQKFDARLKNEDNKQLNFPPEFSQNPIVQNYKNVLLKNQAIQRKIDPVYSGQLHTVYDEVTGVSTKEMSKQDHKTLNNAVEVFHTAQIMGLNNVNREKFESLIDPKNPNNVYEKLNKHIQSLRKEISYYNEENPKQSINALQNNLLLTKGINFNYSGNVKYVGLNSDFHGNMIDSEVRAQMIAEFAELPNDLRNDLLLYDLMKNGWKGFNSLFPLFPQATKMRISALSDIEFNNSKGQLDKLRNAIIINNPQLFASYDGVFKYDNDGDRKMSQFLSQDNPALNRMFEKGDPFIFKTKNKVGKEVMIKFNGFSQEEQVALNVAREDNSGPEYYQMYFLPKVMSKFSKDIPVTRKQNPQLDYITIKGETYIPDNDTLNEINTRTEEPENPLLNGGRAQRRDYYNFSQSMDRQTYDHVMEWAPEFPEDRKQFNYELYQQEKAAADKLRQKVNPETVKNLSNEQLLNLFDGDVIPEEFGGGVGFGNRDKFAYSEIISPIINELATRAATDQTNLTGREYDGNDISVLKKYFMTNNVPSNHPAVQNVVRRMEVEYKKFLHERAQYVGKINDATDALYMEKLGYSPNKKNFKNVMAGLNSALFYNKEGLYNDLYGALIEFQEVTNDAGQKITNMKYKNPERVAADHKAGIVSDAQLNFYNVTRGVSDEMKSFVLGNDPEKGRTDYIPHVAPANLEILSRRGLLGLMVNAKTVDEKIYDVRMDIKSPITGEEMKGVNFKTIEDMYNTLSKNSSGSKYAMDFVKLKAKAIQLNKKGVNQDGTPIRQSQVEISTALGDVFMDRFSNSRSVSSTDLPSMDLNKAFVDYTHATLFQHGNDNFDGFKRMVPVIDGVLAQADTNGDKNVSEYLDKVWKQYFLGGRKQDVLPNIAALEAVGLTSDKIVDYITKGSLVYWLGFKGLAMGAGLYAIGNVLVGKYNNLVDVGGKAWLEGEKRFWMGSSGKFDVTDPFKGWRESQTILKNVGFMDINIYDDVNIDNKNSVEKTLISLALMPMSYSEKWIQGVHFLGKLSPEEWADLSAGKTMNNEQLTEMENSIKEFHGKGYTPTDQRMIQMYSWGRAMMQFNRYIPTMFNTLFGKKDIDIYGKKTMGTYTAVYETIQKGVTGVWTPAKFSEYYKGLESGEKKKLTSGLMSFGLVAGLAAVNSFTNNAVVDKLISDSHMILDTDRIAGRIVPRSFLAVDDIMK